MRVTFLGTGTSHGVPMIGCRCATCLSDDPRDQRWRPSILIEMSGGPSILVDTGPDLRSQALRFGVARVDAILYTHGHADHVMGLDDVRRFNAIQGGQIPCYGDEATIAGLRRTFAYIFDPETPQGGGLPQIVTFALAGEFCLGPATVIPLRVMHGRRPVLGFRVGRFAYVTDCSGIPDETWPRLGGLDYLVLGALRHRPHPTHFTVQEAVAAAGRAGARQTYLTHMCHDLPHAATCAGLPASVQLAYDGLTLEVDETPPFRAGHSLSG